MTEFETATPVQHEAALRTANARLLIALPIGIVRYGIREMSNTAARRSHAGLRGYTQSIAALTPYLRRVRLSFPSHSASRNTRMS